MSENKLNQSAKFYPEPYYGFNLFLRQKFSGRKIRKIPINTGLSCPNKDGSISSAGCIFCDEFGSGPIKTYQNSIAEQIEIFIDNHPKDLFIAYYQAHCNTWAPVNELAEKYEIIFSYPQIVGLFVGTRPDAISAETFLLLDQLNQRTYLSVELGLQSIHSKSLLFLNRNHSYNQFLDTFNELKNRNIQTIVHLILGIPGESKQEIMATVKEMNRLKPAGIKFHLLHILKNTALHEYYLKQPFPLLEEDEYIQLAAELLAMLDPEIVVHRITGERDREIFIAPTWALNKLQVITRLKEYMKQNNLYQGCFHNHNLSPNRDQIL
jgi:radical SAM protein (TIGR01212 family)